MHWLKKKADENLLSGAYTITFNIYIDPEDSLSEEDYIDVLKEAGIGYSAGSTIIKKR